jgi:hypothetical protein
MGRNALIIIKIVVHTLQLLLAMVSKELLQVMVLLPLYM